MKTLGLILFILLFSMVFCFSEQALKPIIVIVFFVVVGFLIVKFFLKKDKEYQKNLILLGGIGITVISWFVNGYINNQNEKNRNQLSTSQSILQSKRDLKIKVLMDAYFRLENSDYRDTAPRGNKTLLYDYIYKKYSESALTAIQLLGGDSTVKIANLYILSGGKQHFSDLLIMLRNELRTELALQELPSNSEYTPTEFRVFRKNGAPNDLTPEQQFQLIIKLNEFDRQLVK